MRVLNAEGESEGVVVVERARRHVVSGARDCVRDVAMRRVAVWRSEDMAMVIADN